MSYDKCGCCGKKLKSFDEILMGMCNACYDDQSKQIDFDWKDDD